MFDENGNVTEDFRDELPELLGDDYYNDPETKQQPTKVLDNVKDKKTFVANYVKAQRKISAHGQEMEEAVKKATEGTVRLPTDESSEEDVKSYRKAIGVPDSEDGYELAIPDTDNEMDKKGYETISKVVSKAALAAGIPKSKLGEVWGPVTAALAEQNAEIEKAGLDAIAADEKSLKEKHKENYKPFMKAGDDLVTELKSGSDFMKLMKSYGIDKVPAVRNLLAEVAPAFVEGLTHFGKGAGGTKGEPWFSDYEEVGGETKTEVEL